ncbi:hypothetical protein RDT67_28740 [Serratia fonticola]|uniref:Uncharacterized protein n=1 Tax=Serratia fonticola TaxID=47917 RepID=A0AAJ2DE05_SERFO|nr:hypothetical protein [Serratia fonticola]MDQ9130391.1 hypothetical protein [Serratia fonticola]
MLENHDENPIVLCKPSFFVTTDAGLAFETPLATETGVSVLLLVFPLGLAPHHDRGQCLPD